MSPFIYDSAATSEVRILASDRQPRLDTPGANALRYGVALPAAADFG